MRVLAAWIVAIGLIAAPAMAGTGAAKDNDSASSANATSAAAAAPQPANAPAAASKSASPATPAESNMESELRELRDLLAAQAKQLEEQQQKMNELEEQLHATEAARESAPTPASAPAAAAVTPAPVASATAAVTPAPTTAAVSNSAAPASAPAAQDNGEAPASLRYKGITITPGGFMAAEAVWRQKAMASDVNTPFNSVPLPGASQSRTDEFNASGRQSRISMLAEGKLSDVKIGGYYEMDFLSSGTTSNNNQSNSYTMRQRQFWGQAAFNDGFTFTGGQMWSLVTETAHGLDNRTENLPLTIDAQYEAGFSWARQLGFRITKDFGNKLWLGMSVEEAQATLTTHGNPTVNNGGTTVCTNAACTTTSVINPTVNNNFLVGAFGTSGGLYNPLGNYQFNPAPDLVFKAALEPGFGHYEVFGLVSQFRDRVFPCVPITGTAVPAGCTSITSAAGAYNDARMGGGVGANARWNLFAKKVDLGIHVLGGNGIGRYGSAGLPDATTRPDGTLALLRNYQALGTLQLHPTPKLDIYFNVGGEYSSRGQYIKSGGTPNEGYGALGLNNSGCWTETLPVTGPSTSTNTGVPTGVGGSTGFIPGALSNCTADTRNLIEGTVGFWYRFYNGPMGRVQWGIQYSNFIRNTWSGIGAATAPGTSGQPSADQNMVFTSFRYYLP